MCLISDFMKDQGLEEKETFQIRNLEGTFYFNDEQLFEEIALGVKVRDDYLLDLIRGKKLIKIKKFKPANGQHFFYYSVYNERVTSGDFSNKNEGHLALYNMGNCFKTFALATRKMPSYIQKYAEIVKEMQLK